MLRAGVPSRIPCGARRGVSLLETLVALTLAVAGLAVSLAAISQSVRAQRTIDRSREEVAQARALVEEAFLGVLPWDEIDDSTDSADIWRGQTESGIDWEVRVTASSIGSFNARADLGEGLGEVQGVASGQMAVQMITVRVGNTVLRTTRW